MPVTIDLPPELERRLREEAAREGRAPEEFVRDVLEERLASAPVEPPGAAGGGARPWAELRAAPEERERILARVPLMRPLEELLGAPAEPATPEEVADLDDWLADREAMRQRGIRRQEEKLAEWGE